MLEGEDAVREGLIDEVGGISQAMQKLRDMIDERRKEKI
jgi:ATP-dependent protease ClpP protease subunit